MQAAGGPGMGSEQVTTDTVRLLFILLLFFVNICDSTLKNTAPGDGAWQHGWPDHWKRGWTDHTSPGFLISEPSFGFRDHITKTFINFRPRVAAKSRCPRIARECHTGLFSQPLPILWFSELWLHLLSFSGSALSQDPPRRSVLLAI